MWLACETPAVAVKTTLVCSPMAVKAACPVWPEPLSSVNFTTKSGATSSIIAGSAVGERAIVGRGVAAAAIVGRGAAIVELGTAVGTNVGACVFAGGEVAAALVGADVASPPQAAIKKNAVVINPIKMPLRYLLTLICAPHWLTIILAFCKHCRQRLFEPAYYPGT